MTSKKNTNKALFSSVIALILCCSMLVGTTFAWFTDEVKSGVNQIVAGNLDVDVLVNGDSIQDKAVLFDEVKLWEPGVVAYENLTVVNKGNLALKYELSVNFDNATKTPAGKTLADVLQVGVVCRFLFGLVAILQNIGGTANKDKRQNGYQSYTQPFSHRITPFCYSVAEFTEKVKHRLQK